MEVPVCLAPENSRMPESEVAVAEAAFEGEAAVMAFFCALQGRRRRQRGSGAMGGKARSTVAAITMDGGGAIAMDGGGAIGQRRMGGRTR